MSRLQTRCSSAFILILVCLHETESNSCNFNIKLTQTLDNEGFHRNLTYQIKYGPHGDKQRWYDGCSVGLEQMLPAGLYASPDEINEMKLKTTTVFKSKVNTESSAEEASPITVHLLGSVRNDMTHMFLPVHARYHKAVAGGGTVKLEIPPPQLYLNCGPKKLDQCASSDTSNVNSFCPSITGHKCLWKEVPIMVSDQLVWQVPRGNTDHHNLVMFATAAVVAFGSLYLVKEVHCFKLRYRSKNG